MTIQQKWNVFQPQEAFHFFVGYVNKQLDLCLLENGI